jgi:hypothetical protein
MVWRSLIYGAVGQGSTGGVWASGRAIVVQLGARVDVAVMCSRRGPAGGGRGTTPLSGLPWSSLVEGRAGCALPAGMYA